jgi:acyl carrier protein
MNETLVLKQLNEILIDILDREDINISRDSRIDDYDEWDSLAHINIVTQIEGDFNIKFTLDEIEEFYSVKNILNLIIKKI